MSFSPIHYSRPPHLPIEFIGGHQLAALCDGAESCASAFCGARASAASRWHAFSAPFHSQTDPWSDARAIGLSLFSSPWLVRPLFIARPLLRLFVNFVLLGRRGVLPFHARQDQSWSRLKNIYLSLARSLVPTVLIINGADWGAGHWAAVAGRARVACATREFPAAVRFIPRVRTGHCVPARVYVFRVFEAARFSHFRQQSGRRCASFSRSTFGPAARAPHLLRRF